MSNLSGTPLMTTTAGSHRMSHGGCSSRDAPLNIHTLPPRPSAIPRHHGDESDVAALSTDDASCGSSRGSTKSEKNMADFDEDEEDDDVIDRMGGTDDIISGAGDELDEADMSEGEFHDQGAKFQNDITN
jgi:hypothetical protein